MKDEIFLIPMYSPPTPHPPRALRIIPYCCLAYKNGNYLMGVCKTRTGCVRMADGG